MPDEDKKFGGSLVLDFRVMTSRENDPWCFIWIFGSVLVYWYMRKVTEIIWIAYNVLWSS